MQLIHFNQELYGNLSAASRGPNGLAILSLFVNVREARWAPGFQGVRDKGGWEARILTMGVVGLWGPLGCCLLASCPLHRWLAAPTHSSVASSTGTPSPESPTRVSKLGVESQLLERLRKKGDKQGQCLGYLVRSSPQTESERLEVSLAEKTPDLNPPVRGWGPDSVVPA